MNRDKKRFIVNAVRAGWTVRMICSDRIELSKPSNNYKDENLLITLQRLFKKSS